MNPKSLIHKLFTYLFKNLHLHVFQFPEHPFPEKQGKTHQHRNKFYLTSWGMSFTYMRNSKIPIMDLCGIPYLILKGSELQISKITLNSRCERYDLIKFDDLI